MGMVNYIYDASGNPVGFWRERFVYELSGNPVGQLRGTHVYKLSGDYVGELDHEMVVDKNSDTLGNIGHPSHPQQRGSPRPSGQPWRQKPRLSGRVQRTRLMRAARRASLHRHRYDLQLTQYDDRGWRATFYTTGMEHSPTGAIGTSWEHTPWHAVQRAAWEALRKDDG
jgi:hypothetical protein